MSEAIEKAVAKWFAGDHLLYEESREFPEVAWLAILEIAKRDLSDEDKALLAAGPLEDLLSNHGPMFIDRVEVEARRNPRFSYLLGGVWRSGMPENLWSRIQVARKDVW